MFKLSKFVRKSRNKVISVLKGNLNKLIVVIGPCSIHSYRSAVAYCNAISNFSKEFSNLVLIMRVYLEKPRTTTGWKGIIYDPNINGSFSINRGISKSIKILKYISRNNIPIATEFLNTLLSAYTSKYITIGAIGARNCESQIHREMSSHLMLPIGFKNDLNCNILGALNSILSCSKPTFCFYLNKNRNVHYNNYNVNKNCFIILRGGAKETNFDEVSINLCILKMSSMSIFNGVFIDFSHGNSSKNHRNQIFVSKQVCKQIPNNNRIVGIMIESHINEGSIDPSFGKISPFISITDSCISITDSYKMLKNLNSSINKRKPVISI
ncbi:3-deoxy-7-phosphoheptulonate synthase [Candidatus Vidania fulgoroideae]|uniref:Phospho-2-dehydro-3-deoxyheptonate aldolase n=1 Tax=Candidatus Vidania fulgoroideorum TaxID=881286 RepID=A0A975AEN2_9PROT|nr:3-deoxy-7-phosphoheptulonate synthase [Candidatus Vidania fulgoroideae]